MTTLHRRAFMAATAASIATPTALSAKECSTAGQDWITMSLEARNLAYNNVEHVGADNARKKSRRLGRSFENAARAALAAPQLGLWKRRAQQVGLISC